MQRAMLGEGGGEGSQLMELPLISKQAAIGDDEMTEEMLLKKTEKNRKRRLAAQKRKEKRKVCVCLFLSHSHFLSHSLSPSPLSLFLPLCLSHILLHTYL
jgi:hypothetical protein